MRSNVKSHFDSAAHLQHAESVRRKQSLMTDHMSFVKSLRLCPDDYQDPLRAQTCFGFRFKGHLEEDILKACLLNFPHASKPFVPDCSKYVLMSKNLERTPHVICEGAFRSIDCSFSSKVPNTILRGNICTACVRNSRSRDFLAMIEQRKKKPLSDRRYDHEFYDDLVVRCKRVGEERRKALKLLLTIHHRAARAKVQNVDQMRDLDQKNGDLKSIVRSLTDAVGAGYLKGGSTLSNYIKDTVVNLLRSPRGQRFSPSTQNLMLGLSIKCSEKGAEMFR